MLIKSKLLCLVNVIQIYAFLNQDSYNILLKDSDHYKIDITIKDEDYVMINGEEIQDLILNSSKFGELNRLAENNYKESWKTTEVYIEIDRERKLFKDPATKSNNIVRNKVNIQKKLVDKMQHDDYEYDYNVLFSEYYDESMDGENENDTYHPENSEEHKTGFLGAVKKVMNLSWNENCTKEDLNQIGFKGLKCLTEEYRNHHLPIKALSLKLWRIIKIWFLVYIAVAIPLWFTRGWCCCCLYCKFFRPHKVIEDAKKYLMKNPPGIFRIKSGKIEYEPTDREQECYEEFEHFVRTL